MSVNSMHVVSVPVRSEVLCRVAHEQVHDRKCRRAGNPRHGRECCGVACSMETVGQSQRLCWLPPGRRRGGVTAKIGNLHDCWR